MKRPTTIQQQESFTVAGSTCLIQRNLDSPSTPQTRPSACFLYSAGSEAHWANTFKHVLVEQRHLIRGYRTSGSGSDLLGSVEVRFAAAALTESRLSAIDRATLLSSLDGKVR
jgi:hypothetical protein